MAHYHELAQLLATATSFFRTSWITRSDPFPALKLLHSLG